MLSFIFLICILASGRTVSADELSTNYEAYNSAELGTLPDLTFHSIDIVAPLLQVNTWDKDATSGTGSHIFIRHDHDNDGKPHSSPLIIDAEDLSVVYVNRSHQAVFDFRVQQNFDKNYLTFYSGPIVDGHGNGHGLVLDESYKEVYKVSAQGLSVHSDLHEFQLSGHGTALVTAYEPVLKDLRAWGGSKYGKVIDGIFQEIDLETNEVVFQWRAWDHIDPKDSYQRVDRSWDFFHINSIQKSTAGNYLISARHMHSLYMIDGQTGDVLWTLGGKRNDFKELSPDGSFSNALLTFAWQHHARFFHDNESEITFFDNHVLSTKVNCTSQCSRGLHVALDFEAKTVRLLREYLHPHSLQSQSQGSVQPLGDGREGNVFVGWGREPSFTEHTAEGKAILDVQFSPWQAPNTAALDNYRAYKMDWSARPDWNPDIAVVDEDGDMTVYVSWNGATEVKSWVLLASDADDDLDGGAKVVAAVSRGGFETGIPLKSTGAKFVRAAALDRENKIIGSTGIVHLESGIVTETEYAITDVDTTQDSDVGSQPVTGAPSPGARPGGMMIPSTIHFALGGFMIAGLVLTMLLV